MDNSPAYENFMNKMSTMTSGRPKINVTNMKIGGLEGRVANNERKITAIKNIFKAQKIDIGKKISPNNTPVEILIQTNETLIKIKDQLELDFINSKKTEEDRLSLEKQLLLKDKREKKETEIETVKKNNKFIRSAKKTIVSPFVDIFEKLKKLAIILGTGLFVNNIVSLMSKPEFVDGLKRIFDWTTKNWKLIAVAGAGLLSLNILGTAATLLKIAGVLKAIVFSPGFIGAALLLGPGLFKVLPKEIKQVITELLVRGGATKENRETLKQELIKELYSIKGIDLFGRREALNKMIRFLDTGLIQSGGVKGQFDFEEFNQGSSVIDSITQFNQGGAVLGQGNKDTVPAMLTPGEFVIKKSAVDKIGLENLYRMNEGVLGNINIEQLAPIDLRKKKVVKKMSGNPATHVEHINPINSSNPYMNEVPMLFGFNDLVYT